MNRYCSDLMSTIFYILNITQIIQDAEIKFSVAVFLLSFVLRHWLTLCLFYNFFHFRNIKYHLVFFYLEKHNLNFNNGIQLNLKWNSAWVCHEIYNTTAKNKQKLENKEPFSYESRKKLSDKVVNLFYLMKIASFSFVVENNLKTN